MGNTELDHKAIGLRIRKQRTFLNMSRDELARKIGITPTFLADIELGTKGFSLKSLNRFCDVLKMFIHTLFFWFIIIWNTRQNSIDTSVCR